VILFHSTVEGVGGCKKKKKKRDRKQKTTNCQDMLRCLFYDLVFSFYDFLLFSHCEITRFLSLRITNPRAIKNKQTTTGAKKRTTAKEARERG